jgi:hypothetical protein
MLELDDILTISNRRRDEVETLRAGLATEHAIQAQMLERLGITWTPGEPFYSLVEAEIVRLRAALERIEAGYGQRLSAAELASMARQAL